MQARVRGEGGDDPVYNKCQGECRVQARARGKGGGAWNSVLGIGQGVRESKEPDARTLYLKGCLV